MFYRSYNLKTYIARTLIFRDQIKRLSFPNCVLLYLLEKNTLDIHNVFKPMCENYIKNHTLR